MDLVILAALLLGRLTRRPPDPPRPPPTPVERFRAHLVREGACPRCLSDLVGRRCPRCPRCRVRYIPA